MKRVLKTPKAPVFVRETDTNAAQEVLVGPADSSSIIANQQQKRVSSSLDRPDGSSSSTGHLSCVTAEATTDMDHADYSRMVVEVCMTWDIVKRIPNYCEVAGVLLFKK